MTTARSTMETTRHYRINEIFYSLQGEGFHTGRAAVFVRFAGCNLHCPFCDTDFKTFTTMTARDIIAAITQATAPWIPAASHPLHPEPLLVVLTGGEPSLQADEALLDQLHANGYFVSMESNGTRQPPATLDWLTISPKPGSKLAVDRCNELKLVVDEHTELPAITLKADHLYLQPCDTANATRNRLITERCTKLIRSYPEWHLSLQTHKLAGFR